MLYDAWNLPDEKGGRIGIDAYHEARHNFTVPGLIEQLYTIGDDWDSEVDKFDQEYSRLAPQSEVGLRLMIYLAKQPTSAQMQQWETQIKEDPAAHHLSRQPLPAIRRRRGSDSMLHKVTAIAPHTMGDPNVGNFIFEPWRHGEMGADSP